MGLLASPCLTLYSTFFPEGFTNYANKPKVSQMILAYRSMRIIPYQGIVLPPFFYSISKMFIRGAQGGRK
jgi:hypothetical protein